MTSSISCTDPRDIMNHAKPESCIKAIRSHVRNLKEEICKIQGIVDSDDLKMCVDVLTGKNILILREDAQKKFEALFYYIQSLKAINEIELILDEMDNEVHLLSDSQS